jgi:hypothetical protein
MYAFEEGCQRRHPLGFGLGNQADGREFLGHAGF